ncbi:hypothetical protein BBK82_07465 [Lentzea guizhouensis]|uniref:Uncharacterized protein n=1 Tax=Lentzea guizhouensis TaxID=1586287 RepID=A0A1B2HE26_9PSEU|nr:hypothetical protein [Lentzea guizhouensis]ANZ35942.1 hypothetical protein BBK82_07465 [Lentzea guizhouensis]
MRIDLVGLRWSCQLEDFSSTMEQRRRPQVRNTRPMYKGPLDDIATNVRKHSGRLFTGRKLANSPVVRACLEAGRRLAELDVLGQADEHAPRPLDTLTQKNVIAEANKIFQNARGDKDIACALFGTPPDYKKGKTKPSIGTMKYAWPNMTLYLGDLTRYVLLERYLLTDELIDKATRAELCETANFSAAVDRIAYLDMKKLHTAETSARLQHLVAGLADFHEQAREALSGVYKHSSEHWRGIYANVLAARGVSLRPGIDLDELTLMLTAMAQGLSLRHIVAEPGEVMDHPNQRSKLGKACQILLAGAVDPGDGRDVAEVVNELMAVRIPSEQDRRKPSRFRLRIRRLRRKRS